MQEANQRQKKKKIVSIPRTQWAALDKKAAEEMTSKSHVIERLIEQFIEVVEVW